MAAAQLKIFISSVQKELAEDRRAIKAFIESDPLLRRFFTVFLFEELSARDRRADSVYLAEVDRCNIYVGLFANDYGYEDAGGTSPTEHEFERATMQGKPRLIFVKGSEDKKRHPKMRSLVQKAGNQLIRRRYNNVTELKTAINESLVDHLESCGFIQSRPFEERPCTNSSIDDLDANAIKDFIQVAHRERQFPLPAKAPLTSILTHMHLLSEGQPTNAAMLLFGRDPQHFFPTAEIRCMHFHGTAIQRPVPFYRIFKGNVFQQVDMAVDFVMSKLNRSIGTRDKSIQAPVKYEIPPDVIREAIVNAIAHRDYSSAGAVQVSVFVDRVEIWNPGALIAPLTTASLRKPHGSICRNPFICEGLFLARYIEKYGTGTIMMIRESLAHNLPEPDFAQRGSEFTIVLWRDWLTDQIMAEFAMNDRQLKGITYLKQNGFITSADYQKVAICPPRTATRDLNELSQKGLIELEGKGRGARYRFSGKRAMNAPNTPQKIKKGAKPIKAE